MPGLQSGRQRRERAKRRIGAINSGVLLLTLITLFTSLGDVQISLDTERAPLSAANFLNYVNRGLYDGATFYRAVDRVEAGERKALVQGGIIDMDDPAAAQERMLPPVEHEGPGQTGLKNVRGAIALARLEPGTAQSEFFINLADAPGFDNLSAPEPPLDGLGYAVFGHVTSGMDVLEVIAKCERRPTPEIPVMDGQVLKVPVIIEKAEVNNER